MRLVLIGFIISLFMLSNTSVFCQSVGTYLIDPNINMEAITWSPNGKIFVLDFQAGSVYRIDGDTLKLLGSGYGTVSGGGLDIQGNFYFSAHLKGEIYKVNYDDTIKKFTSGLSGPVGILLSNDATFFYVVDFDNNSVKKVKLDDGSISEFVSGNGLRGPDGIVRMKNGDLLVSNFTNNQIYRLTTEGNVSYFGSHSKLGNMGYITRAKNFYYVASMSGHTIDRFSEIGERISFAGTGENSYVDGDISEAQFSRPRGITSSPSGDTLLITEKGGRIRYITDIVDFPAPSSSDNGSSFFKLFPNPTFGFASIKFKCQEYCPNIQLELMDMTGKLLSKQMLDTYKNELEYSLDISSEPAGMYYVKIKHEDSVIAYRKVIKVNY